MLIFAAFEFNLMNYSFCLLYDKDLLIDWVVGSSLISNTILENFRFLLPEQLAPELLLEFLVSPPGLSWEGLLFAESFLYVFEL